MNKIQKINNKKVLALVFALALFIAIIGIYLLSSNLHSPFRTEQTWYKGIDGYKEALKQSSLQHKPILIYLDKSICQLCTNFQDEYLDDSLIQSKIEPYIKVSITIDKKEDPLLINKNFKILKYPAIFLQASPKNKAMSLHLIMEMEQLWVAKPTYLRGNFMHISTTTLPIAIESGRVASENQLEQ